MNFFILIFKVDQLSTIIDVYGHRNPQEKFQFSYENYKSVIYYWLVKFFILSKLKKLNPVMQIEELLHYITVKINDFFKWQSFLSFLLKSSTPEIVV